MPYTMSIDTAHHFLDLRYSGIVMVAHRRQAWSEAKPLLHDSGVRRIMIDLLQASPALEPVNAQSDFVSMLTREPLLLASRTAFVAPPVHPINHLIEVLADARHYPFSRFASRPVALAWLLSDDSSYGLHNAFRQDLQPID